MSFASIFEEPVCKVCIQVQGLEGFLVNEFLPLVEEKEVIKEDEEESTDFASDLGTGGYQDPLLQLFVAICTYLHKEKLLIF